VQPCRGARFVRGSEVGIRGGGETIGDLIGGRERGFGV